jgi:signal transduction histidine kinase
LNDELVLTLFQALKDTLGNIVKYCEATSCAVTLSVTSDEIVLQVLHNGTGFKPTELKAASLDLICIKERIIQVGGSLAVSSAPAYGISIEVRAPLDPVREPRTLSRPRLIQS